MVNNSPNYTFNLRERTLRYSDKFSIVKRYMENEEVHIPVEDVVTLCENVSQILFEVTEKCNFNCRYCGYGENYSQPELRPLHSSRFMRWEEAKVLLDYYIGIWKAKKASEQTKVIGFYGGEPLLNFCLIKQIVNYLKTQSPPQIKFVWIITTNGYFVKKYSEFLYNNNFIIDISIDGDALSNSYRVFSNGQETYSSVINSIDYLYENYNEYFHSNVSFQSVITHKAKSLEVIDYLYNRYNIITRIIELSTVNLCENNIINSIYRNVQDDLMISFQHDESSFLQMGITPPPIRHLRDCYKTFTHYYYSSYLDFFRFGEDVTQERILHSGTCLPFFSRIFLTASGYIFPCEKVDFKYPLGYIKDGKKFLISLDKVSKLYSSLYTRLNSLCVNCINQNCCTHCFMQDGVFNESSVKCRDFKSISEDNIIEKIRFIKENVKFLTQIVVK